MSAEQIRAVLDEHHWGDDTAMLGHCAAQCGCGWKAYESSSDIYTLRAKHDAHRAEQIAALLPEVTETVEWGVRYASGFVSTGYREPTCNGETYDREEHTEGTAKRRFCEPEDGVPVRRIRRQARLNEVSEWTEVAQ